VATEPALRAALLRRAHLDPSRAPRGGVGRRRPFCIGGLPSLDTSRPGGQTCHACAIGINPRMSCGNILEDACCAPWRQMSVRINLFGHCFFRDAGYGRWGQVSSSI